MPTVADLMPALSLQDLGVTRWQPPEDIAAQLTTPMTPAQRRQRRSGGRSKPTLVRPTARSPRSRTATTRRWPPTAARVGNSPQSVGNPQPPYDRPAAGHAGRRRRDHPGRRAAHDVSRHPRPGRPPPPRRAASPPLLHTLRVALYRATMSPPRREDAGQVPAVSRCTCQNGDDLISVAAAAQLLAMSRRNVQRLAATDDGSLLGAVRCGSIWALRRSAVLALVREREASK